MKKTLLNILAVMAIYQCSAQSQSMDSKFKLTFGPKFEFPKKHMDLGFMGNETDGLAQLSFQFHKDLTLQKLDSKYAATKSDVVSISKLPSSFISDNFTKLGGKYYWFYSTWDKKDSKENLSVQEVDIKNAKVSAEPKNIISATKLEGTLISTGGYNIQKANKYIFNTSADSTKLLVTYRLEHTTRDDSKSYEVVGFNVFDQNVNKLWSKEYKMPYSEEMMRIVDYTVDSKGTAYVLAKVYEGVKKEKVKGSDEPNYHFELLRATKDSKDLKAIKISRDKYFLHDLYLTEDHKGNIICAGFYSNDSRASSDGIFLLKIDADGNVNGMHKGYYEFPTEILKQFMSERKQQKLEDKEKKDGKEIEAANLVLRNVQLEEDGSILISGEQYYYTITIVQSGNSVRTRYNYFFNDIIAMKISPAGEMQWCTKIPKSQRASSYVAPGAFGHRSLSYYLTKFNDNYYFFYTDNVKNQGLATDKAPAAHVDGAGGYLVYAKADGTNGSITKGKVYDYREKDLYLWPADFEKLSNGVLINRSFDGRQSRVLKLDMGATVANH